MSGRKFVIYLILACFIGPLATGCKKSPSQEAPRNQNPPPSQPPSRLETVARLHWLGKRRLATETNAAPFMSLWALPESQKLEAQTLDKLALAPWNLPRDGTNTAAIVATNANTLLLRPLLEDLVQEECYLEIRGNLHRAATGQDGGASAPATRADTAVSATEIALAIRLDDARSRLWKTNLTSVLASLQSGSQHPISSIQHPTFLRTAQWTVIAFLPVVDQRPPDARSTFGQDGWIEQLANRLGQDNNLPFEETNSWLEAELDLNGLSKALELGWHLPENTPQLALTMTAEGGSVRSVGRLNFAKPLRLELEPWNIPTNLIHDPLASFTAIRGTKSLLASSQIWNNLQLGEPINQAVFWAQTAYPFQTFWAAPAADASNRVHEIGTRLIQNANPWLSTNGEGAFEMLTNANGVTLSKVLYMDPFLKSTAEAQTDFITGGLTQGAMTQAPAPAVLFQQFMERTNLVAYDWELAGLRVESWLYIGQLFRVIAHKPQVPPESASVKWLQALGEKLHNCATVVSMTSPTQLSFVRRSDLGLSSVELHLLADWLESTKFPTGLHTFTAPPPPPPRHHSRTNAVPGSIGATNTPSAPPNP